MKFILQLFFISIIACTKSSGPEAPPGNTGNSYNVTLFSNGYVNPDADINGNGNIDETGLHNWTSDKSSIKTYGVFAVKGKLKVSIKAKSPESNSTVAISIGGKKIEVAVAQSVDYTTITAGEFDITETGYQHIDMQGVKKSGTYFPDVAYFVLYGAAAEGIKYNKSAYRGAASTHLWYTFLPTDEVEWFYNEVRVPAAYDNLNAYYMVNGFDGGYFGIQVNSPTERRILFAVWSNYNADNPNEIPADYDVKLLKNGSEDVLSEPFGGEGSGGHSYLKFNWKTETVYKFLVHTEASGTDKTIYTGYYFAPENNEWRMIASWEKPKTGAKLLSGLYSFVENFWDNGDDAFKAYYGNQWIKTKQLEWKELTECSITTTASEEKHQRYDWGGGAEGNWFYVFSGGFQQVTTSKPYDLYSRNAVGTVPDISNLP
ncbi:DUF3472 domain-containing protein [soil metagenome]